MSKRDETTIAMLAAVNRGLNGQSTAAEVAVRMGYRPTAGRLAMTSRLRAMERAGLVRRIPPRDEWGVAYWFLSEDGLRTLNPKGGETDV